MLTDFLLRIKFNETFTGLIQTEKGEPNCIYVNASIQRSLDYEVKIPLIGCETRRSEDGNYENEITIQNNDVFDAKSDKRYLLTCIPANPAFRDSQVTVSFGGITIDNAATTAISLVNSSKVEYEVTVRDGNDLSAPPLKRPLLVGDRVVFGNFERLSRGRIGRCWASDGKSELDLSDNDGCSLQRAGEASIKKFFYKGARKHSHSYPLRFLQVWGDFEVLRDDYGTTFLSHIKAWAFPTSNEVNIFCNLHLCSDCTQAVCRNRRRRVPPVVMDVTNFRARDDYAPPIPVRASFRLRRDATSAAVTTQKASSSVSRHLNAAAAATTTGRVFPSALYLMLFIVLI
ncbi:unnamed protein product [Angiostrongylus costaricensis]|uniref:ZP domain-containing protein n=1 Tax=Angiostrongylus costaricensis TaxID=334426 RepID=A0A158PCY6_ANGCS|nr:unnamed protein product [Angiostrongylus costaricensis]